MRHRKQELLDEEKLYIALFDIFENSEPFQLYIDELYDITEEYTQFLTERLMVDMDKYAHLSDRKITGNFCQIDIDYKLDMEKKDGHVTDFDAVLTLADQGELNDDELEEFQSWCQDWFFRAFGTSAILYNYESFSYEFVLEHNDEDCEDECVV